MFTQTTLFTALAKSIKLLLVMSMLVFLSACDTFDDETEEDIDDSVGIVEPPSPKVGIFMGGLVSGLNYTTETHSGTTDAEGKFEYEEGETISFFIGGTQLGQTVTAVAEIGPLDLVPGSTVLEEAKEIKKFLRKSEIPFGRDANIDLQYELMNILTFLYSVDSDKLASNGVSISTETQTVFADSSFDLKVRSKDFEFTRGMKNKFYEAYNASAMDSARIIRYWKALDDYAAHLGLTPKVMVTMLEDYDADADGYVDQRTVREYDSRNLYAGYSNTTDETIVEHYNEYGDLMIKQEVDFNEWTETITRDIHGNELEFLTDDLGDGTIDFRRVKTYDTMGNMLSDSADVNNDGAWNSIHEFAYNSEGDLLEEYFDSNANGQWDRIYIYTYDADGNKLSSHFDSDGDGFPNRISTYAYDADGNQIMWSEDTDGDGAPDTVNTYTYDANGNLLAREIDNGDDGTVDAMFSFTYNAAGQVLTSAWDQNNDGQPEMFTMNEYDADGNKLSQTIDTDGDGLIERTYTYAYDAEGNEIFSEYDHENDGVPNWTFHSQYDADNNNIRKERDGNGDGIIDQIYTYSYQETSYLGRDTYVRQIGT